MTQPVFVEPSIPKTSYLRGDIIKNHPVNLSLCKQIRKGKTKWYPDNEGIPCLVFSMIDGSTCEWSYNGIYEDHNWIGHKSNCWIDYDRIMQKFGR